MDADTPLAAEYNKKRKISAKRSWVCDYFKLEHSENSNSYTNKCLCCICALVITVNAASTTELIRHLHKDIKSQRT